MTITDCGQPTCLASAETPNLTPVRDREQLLYALGWVRRGTVQGPMFFCPEHIPDNEFDRLTRKKEQERRDRARSTS